MSDRETPPAPRRTSALERLVAALGLVLVVGMIAALVADARAGGPEAPALSVAIDSLVPLAGGHVVHFTARNAGRRAAAAVVVSGERMAGPTRGASRVTLDYVPGRSSRRGALHFPGDTARAAVRVRVEGYEEP